MQSAFAALRSGGKMVIVGVPRATAQLTLPAIAFLQEKGVIGSFYGSPRFRYDMPRILDLYMAKKLKLDELISRRFKLDQINTAMEIMEQGEVARSVLVY
jgi:S-(hydroxymethyl)glutathione dehydrogenase/alcohol dehydrogenase